MGCLNEERDCARAKAPVPRTNGDRAPFSLVLRERTLRGMATNWGFLAPCRRNAHTPSCLPIISLGLPGQLPVDPLTIRSQDGSPCLLPISASFRNPTGIRTSGTLRIPHYHYAPEASAGPGANYPFPPRSQRRSCIEHAGVPRGSRQPSRTPGRSDRRGSCRREPFGTPG